jgi:type I restriction enzyme, S subunit
MTIVGAGTGNIAIVPDWLEGANLTQTTARIALDPGKICNRYFAYQLQSVVGTVSVELTVKGAAQPGLNLGHISKYRIVVPPLAEQTLIADNLDRETSGFDALSNKVSQAIERLKELRTALISAAVTGKIDVRKGAV